jgi:hypothetical protein
MILSGRYQGAQRRQSTVESRSGRVDGEWLACLRAQGSGLRAQGSGCAAQSSLILRVGSSLGVAWAGGAALLHEGSKQARPD